MALPSSSSELVARACEGDRGAQDALFSKLSGRLRLYADYRLGVALRRRVDVDDVLQEAFLRASQDLAGRRLEGVSDVYRYLSRLLRNVIVDAARAARAARRDGREEPLHWADWSTSGVDRAHASPRSGPFTRAARTEKQRLLEEALDNISPRHRRVIALRQFEQRPASEVLGLMDCETEGAVHALYRRALDAWGAAFTALGGESRVE